MKKIEANQILQKSGKKIFSTSDLRNLFGVENANTLNKQIRGLISANVITRISKGYYYLASNKPSDFELANVLYRPSYISLDSALNYYGILVQTPQEITSVTTKLATVIEDGGKRFSYSHLDPKYFSDYQKLEGFLIATPEKALVDAMFFVALGRGSLSVEELNLESINKDKVSELASKISNRAFKKYFASIKL